MKCTKDTKGGITNKSTLTEGSMRGAVKSSNFRPNVPPPAPISRVKQIKTKTNTNITKEHIYEVC